MQNNLFTITRSLWEKCTDYLDDIENLKEITIVLALFIGVAISVKLHQEHLLAYNNPATAER